MNSIYYERNRNKLFLLFLIITLILLFQDILQQYIPMLKWTDEIIGVCFIPISFISAISVQLKLYREEKVILIAFILFIFIGLCSSFVNGYQDISATVSDLIIVTKFIGAYFFSRAFFCTLDMKKYTVIIKMVFRGITLLFFTLTVVDIVFNIFLKGDKRFIFNSEMLLFSHPTCMAAFCITVLIYLTLVFEKKFIDYIFITQIMFVCASTFRAKAIGLLLAYILLVPLIKNVKKINPSHIILIAVLIFIVFMPQINSYYFSVEDSPRKILTETGLEIAARFFPIGAGFGTYGSYISGAVYSPLYYEYGLSHIWGFEKEDYFFISDTFWPMIIAQFGYLGLILFLVIISKFLILISRLLKLKINYLFYALIPFTYLLISSTSESSFVSYYSVNFFIMIGLAVNQIKINQDN